MKKEEIHFWDLKRWFLGQAPPEFIIEVLIRTLLIYLLLILTARIMGKRMKGQITLMESAVMITLGAIVSPVMQLPDRGLVLGIVALTVAVLFQRGLSFLELRSRRIEKQTQGRLSMLVKDGVMMVEDLRRTDVSRQQLFAMLREQKIYNLGKVKRAYLEACGLLSVYQAAEEKPGLPLFPPHDPQVRDTLRDAGDGTEVCCSCGTVRDTGSAKTPCDYCGATEWSAVFISPEHQSQHS